MKVEYFNGSHRTFGGFRIVILLLIYIPQLLKNNEELI
jgi:hypothetical protein